MKTTASMIVALAALVLAAGCSKEEPTVPAATSGANPPPVFTCENNPENLRAFFSELMAAIRAGDRTKAATMTRMVLPDRDRLAKALKENPGEVLDKAWASIGKFMPGSDDDAAKVFATDPARTEVVVHGATTEEIANHEDGSVPAREFPGGARTLAREGILRPGLTFYEVEILEPGKDSGMKYHLVFFDGERWAMAGPIWRAF